jgi:pantoate--beta-alanine ligase
MRLITTAEEVRHQVAAAKGRNERVALVPTRGDLHEGHLAILRVARAQCDLVVCSIIRPDGRPALHAVADERVARDSGVDLLWRPPFGPLIAGSTITVNMNGQPELTSLATAAAQQLGIVRPHVVYAGEEHFDHARLLRDVVRDLVLDVEVRTVATPHDPDGLPFGTATQELHSDARIAAAHIPTALDAIVDSVAAGERSLFRLRARMEAHLADAGALLTVDDVATVDPSTFEQVDVFQQPVLMLVKAHVDGVPIVDSRLLSVSDSRES